MVFKSYSEVNKMKYQIEQLEMKNLDRKREIKRLETKYNKLFKMVIIAYMVLICVYLVQINQMFKTTKR